MNIYVAAFGLSPQHQRTLVGALTKLKAAFPQILASTYSEKERGSGFIASFHHDPKVLADRRPVFHGPHQSVMYDGVFAHSQKNLKVMRAEVLSEHFDEVESFEGQFSVVRLTNSGLTVCTDVLGLAHVFVAHVGGGWVLSNHAETLLELSSGAADLDAMVQFMVVGYSGDNRTFHSGISRLPPGACWSMMEGEAGPTVTTPSLKALTVRHEVDYDALIERMEDLLVRLSASYRNVRCPLTGGRDSRVIAALCADAGLTPLTHTSGFPNTPDVVIAKQIASLLQLPHERVLPPEVHELNLDEAVNRLFQTTDGTVSLWQLQNTLRQLEPISDLWLSLPGQAGEICRSRFSPTPQRQLMPYTNAMMKRHLLGRIVSNQRGLLGVEAVQMVNQHVLRAANRAIDNGFEPHDLPDRYFIEERMRFWVSAQLRKNRATFQPFLIFATRPFIEAAYALPARQRSTEPLHYNMLKALNPALHTLPFDGKPWANQNPVVHGAKQFLKKRRLYQLVKRAQRNLAPPKKAVQDKKIAFVTAALLQLKDEAFSQPNHPIWDLISRQTLLSRFNDGNVQHLQKTADVFTALLYTQRKHL